MSHQKKHILSKILLLVLIAFLVWVYFWDKPAPEKSVLVDINNEILHK